ncbi:outer membrane beta-barrel protein [uncultured Porphyromonas sp.]|uniref:outer membrane beta-barrel protein n=1 Tax=uncultured Porphyromonas sp. TaxID=159274 RepID=UPI00280416A2|nr:outer membrane beta-barrel protein [uncultured Porphyromonas sp.]
MERLLSTLIRKALLVTGLLLVALSVSAQTSPCQISGVVMDSVRHEAIAYATIEYKLLDEQLIGGAVSNAQGAYALRLPACGTYLIEVRCIGYKTQQQRVTITQPTTQLDFTLEENRVELSEVQVVAKHTKLQSNGNIRVQFKGNPVTKGKSMLEALRFIPSVEVTGNQLLLNGKEDNLIYIGDQQITLQQLNSIPTSMIDHIEVVPNPGVSLGQQIKGGIIYITLRTEAGLLGSVSLRTQFDQRGIVDVGPTLFLQYTKAGVSLYNTLRGGGGRYTTLYERQNKRQGEASSLVTTMSDSKKRDYAVLDNFGVKYQINKQHTLGVFGGVMYDRPKEETLLEDGAGQTLLTQGYDQRILNLNGGVSYAARLAVCEGLGIASTVSYSHSQSDGSAYYSTNEGELAESKSRTHYLTFHPRATLVFAGGNQLTGGLSYNYGLDDNDAGGVSSSTLPQIIHRQFAISGFDLSPYLEYSKMLTQRLYLQAGLRYQTTVVHYRDLLNAQNDYTVPNRGLYPNLLLQYMLNPAKASGIGVAYRHFFSLPNYGYYSPVATYLTKNLYSIGNQRLKQETFDEAEVNYFLNRDWQFTYRVRYGRNIIQIMTYKDESAPDLYYTQPSNVGSRWSHYASGTFNKSLFPFWRTNNILYLRYDQEQMPGRSVQSFSVGGTSTHQFTITKVVGLSVAFSGETARQQLGYTLGGRYSLDLGCYASLLHDQLQLSLSLSNLLHSRDRLTMRMGDTTEQLRLDLSPRRRLALTISYAFSAGDRVKPVRTESAATLSLERPVL